jgi:hypothetical protein
MEATPKLALVPAPPLHGADTPAEVRIAREQLNFAQNLAVSPDSLISSRGNGGDPVQGPCFENPFIALAALRCRRTALHAAVAAARDSNKMLEEYCLALELRTDESTFERRRQVRRGQALQRRLHDYLSQLAECAATTEEAGTAADAEARTMELRADLARATCESKAALKRAANLKARARIVVKHACTKARRLAETRKAYRDAHEGAEARIVAARSDIRRHRKAETVLRSQLEDKKMELKAALDVARTLLQGAQSAIDYKQKATYLE